MKSLLTAVAALALVAGAAGTAAAQPHDDRHDDHHPAMAAVHHTNNNWHQGGRIEKNDWARGSRVDYRAHHLRAPPRGYEWRQVDNNYVLAAAATGLIASVIASSH